MLAKRIILALVFAVLALDAALLVGGAWVVGWSQCSWRETLAVIKDYKNAQPDRSQFASRISLQTTEAGLDSWSTPEGTMWTVHGDTILPLLMSEQQHDIYEPAGHEVRAGDIVLDCGANIGVFTRKALSRGAALVVAVEPAPPTLNALRHNLDVEIRSGRVIVYPKGVWDHDAEMDLTLNETNVATDSVVIPSPNGGKVRVPLTTIDKLVAELKLPRVDFIKMDIEGAEKPAITGAKDTLTRFRPRMSLSIEHFLDDIKDIPALVKSIEPTYTYAGCDCVLEGPRARYMVMAFHPAH